MRIQHNILAMNAYRNYTNNVSALGKNLEKLSSGYKINRAGDDAAGLAISEKMRAQISGLDAAQKNVKDGISLVKTAEGAMQEIQDMLNRMVTLSTQSANGTYDNDVDRAALQQEVDALREEINRIADSANFNGIKLLDGSLDGSVDKTTLNYTSGKNNIEILQQVAENPTTEVGTKTVLKTKASSENKKASFEIELHDLNIVGEHGDTVSVTIGDQVINLTFDRDMTAGSATAGVAGKLKTGTVTANDLAAAIKATWIDEGHTINGQAFNITATSGGLKFEQAKQAENVNEMVEACKNVTVEFSKNNLNAASSWQLNSTQRASLNGSGKLIIDGKEISFTASSLGLTSATGSGSVTVDGYKIEYNNGKLTITNTTGTSAPTSVKIAGTQATVTAADASATGTAAVAASGTAAAGAVTSVAAAITAAIQSLGTTVSISDNGKITFTFYTGDSSGANVVATSFTVTAGTAVTGSVTINGIDYKYTISADGSVSVMAASATASGADGNQTIVFDVTYAATIVVDGVTQSYSTFKTNSIALSGGVTQKNAKLDFNMSGVTQGYTIEFNGTKFTVGAVVSDTLQDIKKWLEKDDNEFKDKYKISVNGSTLSIEVLNVAATSDAASAVVIAVGGIEEASLGTATAVSSGSVASGTWNIKTTKNVNSAVSGLGGNLASTTFKLNSGIVKDGNVLTIGRNEYQFKVGKNSTVSGKNVIDLSMYEEGDLNLIKMAAIKLSQQDNDVFTIGYDEEKPGVISIHEKASQTSYTSGELEDLSTFDAMVFFNSIADETVTETTMHGTALNLQIGDTSDAYNQMKVSIGDMHTDAMGTEESSIADISVATSEDAQAAVDVIRGAINYVSSVRGQLGAYQNRLEHTQNNLSVMAENIQDAESTIRDTDVAEEMMSYVKNNILVQSAQAMLAQANQVPQGVLQLLG